MSDWKAYVQSDAERARVDKMLAAVLDRGFRGTR